MRLQITLLLLFLGVPAFSGAQVIDSKLFGAYDTAMGDREPLLRSRVSTVFRQESESLSCTHLSKNRKRPHEKS